MSTVHLNKPGCIVRTITVLLNCKVCHRLTQKDPLSNYCFGPCCMVCYQAIITRYKQWVLENNLREDMESKQRYINILIKKID